MSRWPDTRPANRAPDGNHRLAQLARRQMGLFTREQAIAAGLHEGTVTKRAARGELVRLQRGVYVPVGVPDSRRLRVLAAVLAAGGEAALARESAAEVHGLPVVPPAVIHLLVHNRMLNGLDGVVVHRTRCWRQGHITSVGPLTATSVARTVVDLAGGRSHTVLRRLVTAAVRDGQATAAQIRRCLDEVGRVRGAATLRTVLDELSPLEARTRSELESLYVRETTRFGVPPTAMNHPVRDVHGRRRVLDAVYLPEKLPVELDGERWHGLPTQRADDLRRENAIVLTGQWRPFLRYSWADLTQRPAAVATEIRAALAAAREAMGIE